MMFETDSGDYDVLAEAAKSIKKVPGLVCEIGTRRAGSTKIIIDALLANGDNDRTVLCIDPYGNIPYAHGEGRFLTNDYTNDMKNDAYSSLYEYVKRKPINLVVMTLEDTEYFSRFPDGLPVYEFNTKRLEPYYALVFFDGPHESSMVLHEAQFFHARSLPGAMFCFDDVADFDFNLVEQWLLNNGWELTRSSYKKKNFRKK